MTEDLEQVAPQLFSFAPSGDSIASRSLDLDSEQRAIMAKGKAPPKDTVLPKDKVLTKRERLPKDDMPPTDKALPKAGVEQVLEAFWRQCHCPWNPYSPRLLVQGSLRRPSRLLLPSPLELPACAAL